MLTFVEFSYNDASTSVTKSVPLLASTGVPEQSPCAHPLDTPESIISLSASERSIPFKVNHGFDVVSPKP